MHKKKQCVVEFGLLPELFDVLPSRLLDLASQDLNSKETSETHIFVAALKYMSFDDFRAISPYLIRLVSQGDERPLFEHIDGNLEDFDYIRNNAASLFLSGGDAHVNN